MNVHISVLILSCLLSISCQHFSRSDASGYGEKSPQNTREVISDQTSFKTAYELGFDPSKSLTNDQLIAIKNRQRVKNLEKTLVSRKEKEQYSKVLPWLKNDSEKIELLTIPYIEGRQQWINSHNIWSRSQSPAKDFKDILDSQDIVIGMPQELVKKSWGDPQSIEVSGNPIYKNERWKYVKFISSSDGYKKETRVVYFEDGKVVGWETQ